MHGVPHGQGGWQRVSAVPQLSCGNGITIANQRRSVAIRTPKFAIGNSLKLPAIFGTGAGDIVGAFEPAVHDVEAQERGVRDVDLIASADAVFVASGVASGRVAEDLDDRGFEDELML